MMQQATLEEYCSILRDELVLAQGCTEPVAIAYAAATAVKALGRRPDKLVAACSGNIFKNVQSVIIPGTGLCGAAAAAVLGVVAGDADRGLEVLRGVTQRDVREATELLARQYCKTELIDDAQAPLVIRITARCADEYAEVTVMYTHTNVVRIEKNGSVWTPEKTQAREATMTHGWLTVEGILEFASAVPLELVRPVLQRQIECNLSIAEEGLRNAYGAGVGKLILSSSQPGDAKALAVAYAAAGSDARMAAAARCRWSSIQAAATRGLRSAFRRHGAAREQGCTEEELLRALIVSNLVAIRIKANMGGLSAFCGAVSAACGAGAGIAYLKGFDSARIGASITNMLANISGMVCDGAKASCAAKIASAVSAALLAVDLAEQGFSFAAGDGFYRPRCGGDHR